MTPEQWALHLNKSCNHIPLGGACVPCSADAIRQAVTEERGAIAAYVRTHKAAWTSTPPHRTLVDLEDAGTEVLADAILAEKHLNRAQEES